MKRHADDVTVAELVRLRVKVEELESSNKIFKTALVDVYWATEDRKVSQIAFKGLKDGELWTSKKD